jgi:hypothetical protein
MTKWEGLMKLSIFQNSLHAINVQQDSIHDTLILKWLNHDNCVWYKQTNNLW